MKVWRPLRPIPLVRLIISLNYVASDWSSNKSLTVLIPCASRSTDLAEEIPLTRSIESQKYSSSSAFGLDVHPLLVSGRFLTRAISFRMISDSFLIVITFFSV